MHTYAVKEIDCHHQKRQNLQAGTCKSASCHISCHTCIISCHISSNLMIFYNSQKYKKTAHLRDNTQVRGQISGGDEENRTPVRKPIHANFYESSRLFRLAPFPSARANRHAPRFGRLQYTDRSQSSPADVHH